MSELSQTIDELRECAEKLTDIANTLCNLFSGADDKKAEETPPPIPVEKAAHTIDEVRTKLGAISLSGHTEQVRALLKKYGAAKLSEVAADDYDALLTDAEELANAT